jgi:hypothetical protein
MREGSRVNTGLAKQAEILCPVVYRTPHRQLAAAIRTIKCVSRYLAVVIGATLKPIHGGI